MFILMGISELPQKELTLNLEYNADYPSASCDRNDNFILVPDGETGSNHECMFQGKMIESGEQALHAEHDQERSGGGGYIRKDLETCFH